MSDGRYEIVVAGPAATTIAEQLPESVAAAADTQAAEASAARMRWRATHSRSSTNSARRVAVDPYTMIGPENTSTP